MIERGADCEGCRISIYSLGGVTEPGPVLGNISGGEREKKENGIIGNVKIRNLDRVDCVFRHNYQIRQRRSSVHSWQLSSEDRRNGRGNKLTDEIFIFFCVRIEPLGTVPRETGVSENK